MLRDLTLQQPCVNDDCISILMQLTNLRTLDIQRTSITKHSLHMLAKKGTLRKVNLSKCDAAVPLDVYCRTPLISWTGIIQTTIRGMTNLVAREVRLLLK